MFGKLKTQQQDLASRLVVGAIYRKILKWGLATVFMLSLLNGNGSARADGGDSSTPSRPQAEVGHCVSPTGHGGGEVPNPFSVNQHVELAAGEYYSLYGTVVAGPGISGSTPATGEPMFLIDLKQHPWLASVSRSKNPYYYLDGGWTFWNRFLQKRVVITAKAKPTFYMRPNGEYSVEYILQPVDNGAVLPVRSIVKPH
jgi:hypothetical protein